MIFLVTLGFIGELATFDKLLQNVEKLDKKGDKEIKSFVKASLEHFQSSVKKIHETKYAEALQELKKLCSETSKVFEACRNKVKYVFVFQNILKLNY